MRYSFPMPLRYVIGTLEIDPSSIVFTGKDVYHEAAHKFVVERREDDEVAIFACPAKGHQAVAEYFREDLNVKNLVGGGSLYVDADGAVVVGSYSGTYGFLPNEACAAFAAIIQEELAAGGIHATTSRGEPQELGFLHDVWKNV
jgi:hypothetical protein